MSQGASDALNTYTFGDHGHREASPLLGVYPMAAPLGWYLSMSLVVRFPPLHAGSETVVVSPPWPHSSGLRAISPGPWGLGSSRQPSHPISQRASLSWPHGHPRPCCAPLHFLPGDCRPQPSRLPPSRAFPLLGYRASKCRQTLSRERLARRNAPWLRESQCAVHAARGFTFPPDLTLSFGASLFSRVAFG